MGTSQALEVAIALVLMFFLISLIASAAVELISQILRVRAKKLEGVLGAMIGESSADVPGIKETATFKTLQQASGGGSRHPSYMSAKAFGDAVVEILTKARQGVDTGEELLSRLPSGLEAKLEPLLAHVGADLATIRAEMERWFDDTMDRLAGVYKRWSQWALLGVGLVLTVAVNASVFGVAARLWHDPVTRASVSQAAAGVAATPPRAPADLKEVARQVDSLDELGLPIGWGGPHPWGKGAAGVAGTILGWAATGLLVMLGAPFWFDVLGRLVSLRGTGPKPSRAADDPASASSQLAAGVAGPPGPTATFNGHGAVPAPPAAQGATGLGVPATGDKLLRALDAAAA